MMGTRSDTYPITKSINDFTFLFDTENDTEIEIGDVIFIYRDDARARAKVTDIDHEEQLGLAELLPDEQLE